jgi:hypothetical protein
MNATTKSGTEDNMSKERDKGSRGEREVVELLRARGIPATRRLQLGKADDAGDIDGVDGFTVEVKNWTRFSEGVSAALDGLEAKRLRGGSQFGVGFVKRVRKGWVVVMTPDTFADIVKELSNG